MASTGKLSEPAQELLRHLNRDLNCLSDENRGVRRQALNKLKRVFFSNKVEPPPEAVSKELFTNALCGPLLERFSDPVEKNREIAIQLVTNFCGIITGTNGDDKGAGGDADADGGDLTPLMDLTIPVISSRLGTHPFPEVAEELRVMLVELLQVFVQHPSSAKNLRRHLGDLVNVVVKASADKFQDTKKATSACCIALCKSAPSLVHLQLQQLVKAQVANFTHHHKAVRKKALLAVCELMLNGSDGVEKLMNGTVLLACKARAHDRNGPVRKSLLTVMSKWLSRLPDRRPFEARLVAILLSGMTDYAPEIQKLALAKMELVGTRLAKKAAREAQAAAAAAAAAGGEGEGGDVAMDGAGESAGSGAGAGAGAGAGGGGSQAQDGDVDMAGSGGGGNSGGLDSGVPDEEWRGAGVMPEVFEGRRPNAGSRALVRRLLAKILPHVLADVTEWVADTRANAAALLVALFAFAEDAVTGHIDTVLAALVRGTSDDDARVRKSIAAAAEVVGRFVDPDAQLAVLLPQARGEVSGLAMPEHRSATLEVLSSVLLGMTVDQLRPHVLELARTLTDPALAEGDPPSLRVRLLAAVNNLLGAGADAIRGNNDVCRLLLRATLHGLARGVDEDVIELAQSCLERLADVSGAGSVPKLFAQFSRGIITDISTDSADWTKTHFNRCVFDATIRYGGAALYGAIDLIIGVLQSSLDPAKPADMRLAQLALVKVLLGTVDDGSVDSGNDEAKTDGGDGSSEVRQAMDNTLRENARVMLERVLLPNMVWRVGRVAATIRKVAVYCFYTLFRRKLVAPDVLRELYAQLAAPIKTCLSDEDSVTRKWSCLLMRYAYALLVGRCTQEEVSDIYHDLVKRLDDSNNDVRKLVCQTLAQFVQVGPPAAYKGTPMEYTVDSMLIHLDDPDTIVQEAVYGALEAWARLDAKFALPRVIAARSRHRTPVFCDRLIEVLQPLAQQQQ